MNSRDLGATLTLAWPGAAVGVMGPRQAQAVLRGRGEGMPDVGVAAAAAQGLIDEVIAPAETRERLISATGAAP